MSCAPPAANSTTAWDKVLADLEVAHHGDETVYSEKVTTVRTHYVDVAAKKTEISSDNKWVDVSGAFVSRGRERSRDDDRPQGCGPLRFRSAEPRRSRRASLTSRPPSVGSNQYGYWSHAGGQSVWTFLPQYLLMRELLWGHRLPARSTSTNTTDIRRRCVPAGPIRPGNAGQSTEVRQPRHVYPAALCQQPLCAVGRIQQLGVCVESLGGLAPRAESGVSPGSSPREEGSAGKRFGGSSGGQKFGSGSSSAGQRFGRPDQLPAVPDTASAAAADAPGARPQNSS